MDLDRIRADLLATKAEIESRLDRTHKHLYEREEPVSANFSEQIKQTENDQLVQALDVEGKEEIRQITAVLKRLDSGDYFQCAKCGSDIGEQRLTAIPYAELCIDCAKDG